VDDYLQAARNLFGNPDAAYYFRPTGDLVKYLQDTNEFGVLTPNNVIRTYMNPSGGANYFLKDIYKWTGLSF
jgi:pyocin large subunit-like protein